MTAENAGLRMFVEMFKSVPAAMNAIGPELRLLADVLTEGSGGGDQMLGNYWALRHQLKALRFAAIRANRHPQDREAQVRLRRELDEALRVSDRTKVGAKGYGGQLRVALEQLADFRDKGAHCDLTPTLCPDGPDQWQEYLRRVDAWVKGIAITALHRVAAA